MSQIKKYMKSPAEWAGRYILGIKEDYINDSMTVGTAFHKYLETGDIDLCYKILEDLEYKEKGIEQFDILVDNSGNIDIPDGDYEKKVEFKLWGQDFVGYIDLITEDSIIDFKTVSKLSKEEDKPMMWQVVNNYEEYKLQCRAYMIATGKNKASIYEYLKRKYKTKKPTTQVINFERTTELDKEMDYKYKDVIQEMIDMKNKFIIKTK